MGLDFSHGEAHWSYSGFHRFRERLAKEIGIADLAAWWDQQSGTRPLATPEPLVWLLEHSDCDGALTRVQCALIAPRLREVVADWPDDYDREQALKLATGMEMAAFLREELEFC